MKKFVICVALLSILSTPVWAKPFHHPNPIVWHKPAPVIVHTRYHAHMKEPLAAVASGIIGFVAGTALASSQTYYGNNISENKQCFAFVSKSNGTVTQHCLSGDNQVLYID